MAMEPTPRRPPKARFSMAQMMGMVALAALFMAFFAAIREPRIILIILVMGAGYWLIFVLPFFLTEKWTRPLSLRLHRRHEPWEPDPDVDLAVRDLAKPDPGTPPSREVKPLA